MSEIICKSCGEENEIGRIYCNNCGAKLDLSAFKREALEKGQRDYTPTEVRRKAHAPHLGKRSHSRGGDIKGTIVTILIVIAVLAALGGLGYLGAMAYLQPEMPKFIDYSALTDDEKTTFDDLFDTADLKKINFSDAIMNGDVPVTEFWSGNQVNAILIKTVKSDSFEIGPIKGKFKGANIHLLDDDMARVVLKYEFYGQPFFIQYWIHCELVAGELQTTYRKCMIGKLAIPEKMIEKVKKPLQLVGDKFRNERQLLEKCEKLTIEKDKLTVTATEALEGSGGEETQ